MNERREEIKSGTRREFLLEAGAAAGGAALIGATSEVEAQDPKSARPDKQQQPIHFRASSPHAIFAKHLGPLADLPGTWIGKGFNLISLPDFTDGKPFRLKLNATIETLAFTPIGGNVPNRGSSESDLTLFGLTYLQRVSDLTSNAALHIEPGIWLHVPATTTPPTTESVVRQATIPHGDALLAMGGMIDPIDGPPPPFAPADSTPLRNPPGAPLGAGYLTPFANPPLPDTFKAAYVANPNLALTDAIAGQNIVKTVVLVISTANNGGILNIPFVTRNANATKLDAIFWIETIKQPDNSETLQLQYTQTVILNFLGIDWPHISVATLVKQ
jgi:hypothetical protein